MFDCGGDKAGTSMTTLITRINDFLTQDYRAKLFLPQTARLAPRLLYRLYQGRIEPPKAVRGHATSNQRTKNLNSKLSTMPSIVLHALSPPLAARCALDITYMNKLENLLCCCTLLLLTVCILIIITLLSSKHTAI